MRKRNNFVKFIFSLLLLVSIFTFSFSACNNVVEASTVESKPHDDGYEYIYFTPLEDIEIGGFDITFQGFISQARIDIEWNALSDIDIESESYSIDNRGDTLVVNNPIEYLADTEYCIKIGNENYFGISGVSDTWYELGITHCYFNYFRFTSDFGGYFLDSSCVEASFLECLKYDGYNCSVINSDFFSACAFEKIYLPLYLNEIYCPFNSCENLTDIYFMTLPYAIEGVSIYCYELKNYWLKDSNDQFYSTQILVDDDYLLSMIGGSIPSYVLYIEKYCFSSFNKDTLIIPSTISKIYGSSFYAASIGDLIFTSQVPPTVLGYQNFDKLNRIIVPYDSYDTYMTQDFFTNNSDIVFKSEKPLWSASLITSIISILMGGISSLSYGIGSGLTDLVSSIFVSSNGGLSLFGGVIIVFAGLSFAIGLCRLIISFITSLGGDD